jgi:hypothetical protein
MDEILIELKEIKKTLNIYGQMIENILEILSEGAHNSEKAKHDVNQQMKSVYTLFQNTPGLKDNPVLNSLFENFKDKLNDR